MESFWINFCFHSWLPEKLFWAVPPSKNHKTCDELQVSGIQIIISELEFKSEKIRRPLLEGVAKEETCTGWKFDCFSLQPVSFMLMACSVSRKSQWIPLPNLFTHIKSRKGRTGGRRRKRSFDKGQRQISANYYGHKISKHIVFTTRVLWP